MAHWTQEVKAQLQQLQIVLEELKVLQDKMNVLEKKFSEFDLSRNIPNTEFNTPVQLPPQASSPIPIDYRQITDELLNRSFEIEIFPRPDVPVFEFVINVPKKYSNASDAYWQMYKNDRRVKVIDYAVGSSGIREYCEKVFNSFNPTIQAMIVADRVQAQ